MLDQNCLADASLARDRKETTMAVRSVIEEALKVVKYRAALEKLHHGALSRGGLRRVSIGDAH
jgi:hypothetical protein